MIKTKQFSNPPQEALIFSRSVAEVDARVLTTAEEGLLGGVSSAAKEQRETLNRKMMLSPF